MTDFSLNLTSRRKPEAIVDGYPVSAIFPDVSIRSHRLWWVGGIPLPAPGPSRERRRNPRSLQAKIVPSSELSRVQRPPATGTSPAFRRCDKRLREEGIPSGGEVRRVPALRPRVLGNGERHQRPACAREPAADGAGVVPLGRQDAGRRKRRIPSGRRLKSGWLGFVRELGPGQRHLMQDPAVALALDLFGQAPALLGKAAILCGRVHVATTRPSAPAFRMHAGHADRNRRPRRDLQRKVDESQSGDHAPTVLRRPERARR
jgi:hypothetical protein